MSRFSRAAARRAATAWLVLLLCAPASRICGQDEDRRLTVRAVDLAGDPVHGAVVEVWSLQRWGRRGVAPLSSSVTDDAGSVEFQVDGIVDLFAHSNDYRLQSVPDGDIPDLGFPGEVVTLVLRPLLGARIVMPDAAGFYVLQERIDGSALGNCAQHRITPLPVPISALRDGPWFPVATVGRGGGGETRFVAEVHAIGRTRQAVEVSLPAWSDELAIAEVHAVEAMSAWGTCSVQVRQTSGEMVSAEFAARFLEHLVPIDAEDGTTLYLRRHLVFSGSPLDLPLPAGAYRAVLPVIGTSPLSWTIDVRSGRQTTTLDLPKDLAMFEVDTSRVPRGISVAFSAAGESIDVDEEARYPMQLSINRSAFFSTPVVGESFAGFVDVSRPVELRVIQWDPDAVRAEDQEKVVDRRRFDIEPGACVELVLDERGRIDRDG
jgi:hypothetical protein